MTVCICANCINLSTKVCLFFVSLLTLELVFFTQWQSVRWLLFFSCLVWHQGQIPSTILFNAHLLLLLTQAGFTLKNVEIQRVNLEKMGEKSKINFCYSITSSWDRTTNPESTNPDTLLKWSNFFSWKKTEFVDSGFVIQVIHISICLLC